MLKKLLAALLALSLLCSAALAEEDQIAALEARIAELEAENAELRELLSQEESARLLAARFDGGVITVREAKANTIISPIITNSWAWTRTTTKIRSKPRF